MGLNAYKTAKMLFSIVWVLGIELVLLISLLLLNLLTKALLWRWSEGINERVEVAVELRMEFLVS